MQSKHTLLQLLVSLEEEGSGSLSKCGRRRGYEQQVPGEGHMHMGTELAGNS